MAGPRLLKIRLSLKGRPIKSYTFNKDTILIGRSPEADVFLDNPGVSREHVKLEMTNKGYYAAEDLGSANGTYLNDQPISREFLMNNDVLRIGKFSLWMNYEEDRRGMGHDGQHQNAAHEGTMVLSSEELEGLITKSKESETNPVAFQEQEKKESPAPRTRKKAFPSRGFLSVMILVAFLLGTVVGAGASRILTP